ncbi:MAG: bifunctional folylpolyglutamate synthase/dihydrofolate synthase [Eubacterium sp.]
MDYKEAKDYLNKVNKFGSVLGLDSIRNLLLRLGNPHMDLKAVHVAGTNGKGSTITFLQSILMEAGYKVGRYSSPAVFDDREIIRINDDYIDKGSLADIITVIKEKCNEMVNEGMAHPTPFEIETAMAFLYFKEKKCDIVLVECGMGGETDATNVFDKVLCSVITTISLDHMQFLGNTIKQITGVKAGIIKENCPVVMSYQSKEAMDVVQAAATVKKSLFCETKEPYHIKIENYKTYFEYRASNNSEYHIELSTMGTYQIVNSTTAIETALILEKQGFVLEEYIECGLEKAFWSGRLEIVSQVPFMVIDGAHNPGAVKELKQSIDLYFTNKRITFIMGVLADKDFSSEAEIIAGCAEKIITVTPDHARALDGKQLAETLRTYNDNVQCAHSIEEAVQLAKGTIDDNVSDMILAFGSLSYLGKLKSIIKNEANS